MEYYRKALEGEKQQLEQQLEKIRQRMADNIGSSGAELSLQDQHPADTASDLYEQERDLGIAANLEATLDRIEQSLERLDQGEYGVCRRCQRPISLPRLKALPYATLCVDCAREVESGYAAPAEEKNINFAKIKEMGHGFTVGGEMFYDPEHEDWNGTP